MLLIVIKQAQVALDVRLSFFSRDFYNAPQGKDQVEFRRQLGFVFLPFASILIGSFVIEYVVTSSFVIRWRRWLSARYIGVWLGEGAHDPMALAGTPADNPDQRISEDIHGFIYGGGSGTGLYGHSVTVLQTLTSLVSYAIVLWGLFANFTKRDDGRAVLVEAAMAEASRALTAPFSAASLYLRALADRDCDHSLPYLRAVAGQARRHFTDAVAKGRAKRIISKSMSTLGELPAHFCFAANSVEVFRASYDGRVSERLRNCAAASSSHRCRRCEMIACHRVSFAFLATSRLETRREKADAFVRAGFPTHPRAENWA